MIYLMADYVQFIVMRMAFPFLSDYFCRVDRLKISTFLRAKIIFRKNEK